MDSSEEAVSEDEFEDDNDFSTTNTILLDGDIQNHTFDNTSDEDYIRLDLSGITPDTYIKLETYFLNSNIDTELFLYNSSYIKLYYNDDAGPNIKYSRIIWKCSSAGIYYLRVREFNKNNGYYSINALSYTLPSADAYESNDTDDVATELIIDDAFQNHTLHDPTDVDWFKFNGISGTDYTIYCEGDYDILDMCLCRGDDLGFINNGNISEPMEFKCVEDLVYKIEIISYNDQVGEYSIRIERK